MQWWSSPSIALLGRFVGWEPGNVAVSGLEHVDVLEELLEF